MIVHADQNADDFSSGSRFRRGHQCLGVICDFGHSKDGETGENGVFSRVHGIKGVGKRLSVEGCAAGAIGPSIQKPSPSITIRMED